MSCHAFGKKALGRKPLSVYLEEASKEKLNKTFDLLSLLCIGIGGTVGSGIFVLSGEIANKQAGAGIWISWLIGGAVCGVTALAYAELSTRTLSAGSTYAFVHYGLGEAFAMLGGWFLTLEYGLSGAAVARSWGDKVAFWFSVNEWAGCTGGIAIFDTNTSEHSNCWVNSIASTPVNPGATFISVIMVTMLSMGATLGKRTVNTLVCCTMTLLLFSIVLGFYYTKTENLTPVLAPSTPLTQGGMEGVLAGATLAFFGFIGFDEVTCLTAEAINPKRDIPIAVLGTIACVTLTYSIASLALVGMMNYTEINNIEGFGGAFVANGANWAMQIVMIGQIFFVLPSVVLVSYLPQSRLLYAMSLDGMVPKVFGKVRESGTLLHGTLISGAIMTLFASFVPFTHLNNLISGGILLSFAMTNTALVQTRSRHTCWSFLLPLLFFAMSSSFLINKGPDNGANKFVGYGFAVVFAGITIVMKFCRDFDCCSADGFVVPLMPFVPCLAIYLNFFLFAQLPMNGVYSCIGLIVISFIAYGLYGYRNTVSYQKPLEVKCEQGPEVRVVLK